MIVLCIDAKEPFCPVKEGETYLVIKDFWRKPEWSDTLERGVELQGVKGRFLFSRFVELGGSDI